MDMDEWMMLSAGYHAVSGDKQFLGLRQELLILTAHYCNYKVLLVEQQDAGCRGKGNEEE